jgi:hypothetical protein
MISHLQQTKVDLMRLEAIETDTLAAAATPAAGNGIAATMQHWHATLQMPMPDEHLVPRTCIRPEGTAKIG